jgi:hypothetical protein
MKGDFAEPKEDAEFHRAMLDAVRFFEGHKEGSAAMHTLLADPKEEVRGWIAAHLLSKGDSAAREVLKKLSAGSGPGAFSASMTLVEQERGRLRSPFL